MTNSPNDKPANQENTAHPRNELPGLPTPESRSCPAGKK
jgi:hypothetical protein